MKDCKGAGHCECHALDLSSGHDIDDFCKQVCTLRQTLAVLNSDSWLPGTGSPN